MACHTDSKYTHPPKLDKTCEQTNFDPITLISHDHSVYWQEGFGPSQCSSGEPKNQFCAHALLSSLTEDIDRLEDIEALRLSPTAIMEIKVSVEGVQRIVCGVSEKTTCQEIVIALAKVLDRTGRYTLKEKFKEYKRNVAPDERFLEALKKYGEQVKEVEFTLHYVGPSQATSTNQPRVPLRRLEEWKVRRGSAGAALHRQSLPPLSLLQFKPPPEELKRPKRKSVTLMEEAWSWLESLGRGGKQHSIRDKGRNLKNDRRDEQLDNMAEEQEKCAQASRILQRRDDTDHKAQISYLGKERKEKLGGSNKQWLHTVPKNKGVESEHVDSQLGSTSKAVEKLRRVILQQQAHLEELKLNLEFTDKQIQRLEMQQAETTSEMSEEEEQLEFWLNELRAEEGAEKDLQKQFLNLKEKAAECKNTLEEYKIKLQLLDLTNKRNSQCQATKPHENSEKENASKYVESTEEKTAAHEPTGARKEKIVITKVESRLSYIFVTTNQITESQPSGPSELREWCSRWTEVQKPKSGSVPKVVHRSEIKIHLGGTRV